MFGRDSIKHEYHMKARTSKHEYHITRTGKRTINLCLHLYGPSPS